MHNIAEFSVLLRAKVELPADFRLARDGFQEGWDFVRSGGAPRLERKVQKCGWSFIKFEGSSVRSGVGDTVQAALASAVKLALRRVSVFFNAVEIQHIQITTYPWFVLARIIVNSYRIQEATVAPVPDQYVPAAIRAPQRRWPDFAGDPYLQFGSDLPILKQLLAAPRNHEVRPQ